MILRRMRANFGVLSRAEMTLTPGLNVIEAPNESGKSTWCAFLRVMLYGPENARGGRNGTRSDRELYAPWDGTAPEGTLELSWEGKEITLRRSTGPAGPMRAFSAVYTGTNRSVSALTERDAGERLTGLGAEVFRRTAFIGPAGLRVLPGPEMEKYIASSVASGEEGVSYTEAAARLRSWQRRYRYRDQGRLSELEAQLRRSESERRELESLARELEETERREERAAAAYSELTDRIAAPPKDGGKTRTEEELRRREREAETIRSALRSSPLAGEEPGEALLDKARADSRRSARLLRETHDAAPGRMWLVCFVLAAALAAAGALRPILLVPAAAALVLGTALFAAQRKQQRRIALRTRELAALRKRYGTTDPKGILAEARSYAELGGEMRTLTAAAEELRAGLPEGDADGSEPPDTAALAAAAEELRAVSAAKARLLARRDALPDRETLIESIDALRSEIDKAARTFVALGAALDELAAADEEMQARFAPALSRRTERIFRALTAERYDSLTLDRDLTAAVRLSGEEMPRAGHYLSRGARDQLYLALRLALCEESDCPLILDDALIAFDDKRMGLALDCLRELAETRQILLFTCQSREKRYLEHTYGYEPVQGG